METLSWTTLERHLGSRNPFLVSLGGERGALIGVSANGALFVRLPASEEDQEPATLFNELQVKAGLIEGARVLELMCDSVHLRREFHRLAGLIAEDFESSNQTASGAISSALQRWRELTATRAPLSHEQELGLLGELVVLEGLVRTRGTQAVDAWTAKEQQGSERHDFRIDDFDLEVKTTTGRTRIHMVNGLKQLLPSAGHRLFLISLLLEKGGLGQGTSLNDLVATLRRNLSGNAAQRSAFESRLKARGYADEDAAHYAAQYIFADTPALIPVDESCPKLTTDDVQSLLGPLATRLLPDVVYRINVEGMGYFRGELYEAILGTSTLKL